MGHEMQQYLEIFIFLFFYFLIFIQRLSEYSITLPRE